MAITINGNGTVTGISVGGLPDGIVDNDMIANTTIAEGKLAASVNTLEMVDSWKINSNFSQSSGTAYVTSNWERMVTNGTGWSSIGSALTESSGVFSFPATGIYLLQYNFHGRAANVGTTDYSGARIYVSVDAGSNFSIYSYNYAACWADDAHFNCSNFVILDVTNTSNVQFKFNVETHNTTYWFGESNVNRNACGFYVLRLGDT